jgi:hypothetical protein
MWALRPAVTWAALLAEWKVVTWAGEKVAWRVASKVGSRADQTADMRVVCSAAAKVNTMVDKLALKLVAERA